MRRAGEVERGERRRRGAPERHHRRPEPVGLAGGIAQHPAGGGQAGEDGVAGRLVHAQAAGELGQREGLVGVVGEQRHGGDDPIGRR